MPKRTVSPPVFDESRQRWKATIPASLSPTGKRLRAWFKTRNEARDYIAEVTDPADIAATIPPKLAEDADTARQRLAKAGLDMTVAEAVREFVEAREILKGAGSLAEAAQAFAATHAARNSSVPFGEAVAHYLDVKAETVRERTLREYGYTLEKTLAPLRGKILADVSAGDIAEILGQRKPTARAIHFRNLRAFVRWAAKAPRHWARAEMLDGLEYAARSPEGDTKILRPADVRALLCAAEGYSPHAACAFALAIFGGIRMAELARLTWGDIQEEYVEIGASVAKKSTRRLVPISPALAAWLEAYRPEYAGRGDCIVGANWRDASKRVRRLAGWDVAARGLEVTPPEPTRGRWPQNACRHTCASVLVATGEPLETLIFQFGHGGGHELLRRHYLGRLTKRQAVEILSIGPRGEELPMMKSA